MNTVTKGVRVLELSGGTAVPDLSPQGGVECIREARNRGQEGFAKISASEGVRLPSVAVLRD